jgi:hypothetical protein
LKKREKRRGRKRKAPRVSSKKGEVNILRREKHFNIKIFFLMWFHFLLLHHTISKTPSKIIEKVFLTLFGPSYSLAIYITQVVGRMRRNICWAELRNHIPKRVPECLMLRNHIIIAIIFSPIDFKKMLSRRDTDKRFHLSTAQDKVKNSTIAPWGN